MKALTGMGGIGTAADLAEMLRRMGRGRDTVLAHITPEEADMLMRQGGAGTTNPMTGLPEFLDIYGDQSATEVPSYFQGEDANYYYPGDNFFTSERVPEGSVYDPATRTYTFTEPTQVDTTERFAPSPVVETRPEISPRDIGFGPDRFFPEVRPEDVRGAAAADVDRMTGVPTTSERLGQFVRENPRLVGYGAQSLVGALQAARMRRQTAREAERLRALGAPMRQEGENLRQQALAGNLTPQQARQLEASIARSRQAAVGRGTTTGTQEAMLSNVAQRTKADLLQTNLANSLKLLNLANAYDEAAIKAELAANRESDEILASIFGNIAQDYAASGQPRNAPPPPPAAPRAQTQSPMGNQEITRRPDVRG
jgi:hypothetical protein